MPLLVLVPQYNMTVTPSRMFFEDSESEAPVAVTEVLLASGSCLRLTVSDAISLVPAAGGRTPRAVSY